MCDRLQFILKIGQAHFWELRGGGNEKNNNYSQGGRWNVQTFSRTVSNLVIVIYMNFYKIFPIHVYG